MLHSSLFSLSLFFSFTDPPTTEIYTLSLHDALPIFRDKSVLITGGSRGLGLVLAREFAKRGARVAVCARSAAELEREHCERSEEHTSELQSHHDLVCRLLLEKKKKKKITTTHDNRDT